MRQPIRILLVEDNRADAQLLEELIIDTGVPYILTWINEGQQALDFFNSGKETDIILLDLNMPRVSGREVLTFLKERAIPTKIPVIIMTGSGYGTDIEHSKKNGVARYLIKPMSIKEMKEVTGILKDILLSQRDLG